MAKPTKASDRTRAATRRDGPARAPAAGRPAAPPSNAATSPRRTDWSARDRNNRWSDRPGAARPPWNGARAAAEPDPGPLRRPVPASVRRMYRRRRRAVLLALVLVLVTIAVVAVTVGEDEAAPPTRTPVGAMAPAGVANPGTAASGSAGDRVTEVGNGERTTAGPARTADTPAGPATIRPTGVPRTPLRTESFDYASGPGPVLGTAGTLRRFQIAVESGHGGPADDFAHAVDRVLGDPRSWIGGRQVRLQRVPQRSAAHFTVYLATAATSQRMCAVGGLDTAGYTSCRLAGQVIINLDRWKNAVPNYGAPLATYQAYAINHEVGHELGHGHEACPGAGQPAPVMQQQTYGLKGCTANPWPHVGGRRYAGPPVA